MARADAIGFADFLEVHVAAEIQDRLLEVNRSFPNRALIGRSGSALGEIAEDRCDATETLALEPGAYDLVIHALSLHASNDPVGQLIQMRHALRPDGMAMAVLFGGQSLIELREALTQAEAEVSGGLRPRVAPMAEIRDLGGLLQRAGFALPVADAMTLTITYESLSKLMQELRAMGETNTLVARPRGFSPKRLFARAEKIYRDRFGLKDGRLPVTVEIIFLTGWMPDISQQKPLQPGSAQMRLADALKGDKARD